MLENERSPLVSVIVPSYEHESYIISALESVAKQTYSNIELIVLDDCSTDSTLQLAEKWAENEQQNNRFVRLIVERNPQNIGAHATINRGIEMCSGEYISILNSDDIYDPQRIKILLETAILRNTSLVFSGVNVVGRDGKHLVEPGLASEIESMPDYADTFPSLSCALLSKNIAVSTGNLFFSRNLTDCIGNFRPLRYCHDWDFVLRSCLVNEPFLVPLPLYSYRMHETNSYTLLKIEKFLEPQIIYQFFMSSCKSGNCVNPELKWSTNPSLILDAIDSSNFNIHFGYKIVGEGVVKYNALFDFISDCL